jgi:hypothetical protein
VTGAASLGRGSLGDEPAVVEQRDPVGELVDLLQVLRGEEDGDPAGDEVPDDLPHLPAAAWVSPVVGWSGTLTHGSPTKWSPVPVDVWRKGPYLPP